MVKCRKECVCCIIYSKCQTIEKSMDCNFLLLQTVVRILFFFCWSCCVCIVCVCVRVCQGAGGSELPLTATHIYNRTENKTTAVTYKVFHQYPPVSKIYFIARSFERACARAHARQARTFHAEAALFHADLWVRLIFQSAKRA